MSWINEYIFCICSTKVLEDVKRILVWGLSVFSVDAVMVLTFASFSVHAGDSYISVNTWQEWKNQNREQWDSAWYWWDLCNVWISKIKWCPDQFILIYRSVKVWVQAKQGKILPWILTKWQKGFRKRGGSCWALTCPSLLRVHLQFLLGRDCLYVYPM